MNMFEQISSAGHQMSLAEDCTERSHVQGWGGDQGWPVVRSHVGEGGSKAKSDPSWVMVTLDSPYAQNEGQTRLKT